MSFWLQALKPGSIPALPKVLPTLHFPMSDTLARAPAGVPSQYEAKLNRTRLHVKVIPYILQERLANEGCVTMDDPADRWNAPEETRLKAPTKVELKTGENQRTEKD